MGQHEILREQINEQPIVEIEEAYYELYDDDAPRYADFLLIYPNWVAAILGGRTQEDYWSIFNRSEIKEVRPTEE